MCCQIPDYFLSKSQRNNSSIVFTLLSLIFEAWGGFPGSSASKESACNAGDPGLIPGSEDPLEKG